jgi:S-adenosylmethionine/arginine decarboxylase-like enzyme
MFRDGRWLPTTDPDQLRGLLLEILFQAGFGVLEQTEHYFEPHGWSWVVLLAESHCAVHSFPEGGRSWVELSSCALEPYLAYLQLMDSASP